MPAQENEPRRGREIPAEPFGIPIPPPKREDSKKNFPLVPNLNMIVDVYTEMNYEKEALAIYQWETDEHPEIFVKKKREGKKHFEARKNIRAQMAFVRNAMNWEDGTELASYLGVDDPSKVMKKGYCGPMKPEARQDFLKRLRGMFAITSILKRYINDKRYPNAIDRRAAIDEVNGFFSDVRFKTIIRDGNFNVATCVTQLTVKQWEEARDMQVQKERIGLHADIPNPDDEGMEHPYNEAAEYQPRGTGGTDEEMQTDVPEKID